MTKEQRQFNGQMLLDQLNIHLQKNELKHRPTLFTSISSKLITDLNVKYKSTKVLEKVGENLHSLGFGNEFVDINTNRNERKNYELNFLKNKNFCSSKDTVKRMKRQATDWEKIFAKHVSDKSLAYKIYKGLLDSTIRKQTI